MSLSAHIMSFCLCFVSICLDTKETTLMRITNHTRNVYYQVRILKEVIGMQEYKTIITQKIDAQLTLKCSNKCSCLFSHFIGSARAKSGAGRIHLTSIQQNLCLNLCLALSKTNCKYVV